MSSGMSFAAAVLDRTAGAIAVRRCHHVGLCSQHSTRPAQNADQAQTGHHPFILQRRLYRTIARVFPAIRPGMKDEAFAPHVSATVRKARLTAASNRRRDDCDGSEHSQFAVRCTITLAATGQQAGPCVHSLALPAIAK